MDTEQQIVSADSNNNVFSTRLNYWEIWRLYTWPVSPYIRLFIWLAIAAVFAIQTDFHSPLLNAASWCWGITASLAADFVVTWATQKSLNWQIEQLAILKDGLIAKGPSNSQIFINWLSVKSIRNVENAVMIKTSGSPELTFVIPQRSLDNKVNVKDLVDDLNTAWSDWLLNGLEYKLNTTTKAQSGLTVESNISFFELLRNSFTSSSLMILPIMACLFLLQHNYFGSLLEVVLIIFAAINIWNCAKHPDLHEKGITSINQGGVQSLNGVTGCLTVHSWEFFKKVYVRNNILCFERDSCRILVPMRCFESKESGENFVSQAKQFFEARKLSELASKSEVSEIDQEHKSQRRGMSNFCSDFDIDTGPLPIKVSDY